MRRLFVLLLVCLLSHAARGHTLDTEHALYSNMEAIYVFDGRPNDGNNIAGTGTMVGTVEDTDGFDAPISQTFQSWYNNFGSGYTICIWHSGWSGERWYAIERLKSDTDGNALTWCRDSANTYLRVYHNDTGSTLTDVPLTELASPMMLSLVWDGDDVIVYDGNDVIGTKALSLVPRTTCVDAAFAIDGTTTVSRFYWFDTALSPAQLGALEADPNSIFLGGPEKAADPYPADDATNVAKGVVLHWDTVADACDYDVYLSRVGQSLVLVDTVDSNEYDPPVLGAGIEYQWRVDPNNDYGTTTGDVWTFTTSLAKATGPYPDDGAIAVPIDQILSWEVVEGALDYDVYVGFVGGDLIFQDNIETLVYDPDLTYSQAYQWRIDANTASVTTTGDVWEFYTTDEPEEPNEPEPQSAGWQKSRQWRKNAPGWIKRETGLEGWRKR